MTERKKWANLGICVLLAGLMALFVAGCDEADDDDPELTGKEIVLINLGDSLTNGVQGGDHNANRYTQINGFAPVLANQMKKVVTLIWNNPLLDMNKKRLDPTIIPFNVGVSGATSKSLVSQTSDQFELLNQLLQPLPAKMGRPITQLEAAVYVANQYPNNQKIFTFLIGPNDLLRTINAGGGTQLTATHINAFLSDKKVTGEPLNEGHDLESVRSNITKAINTLKAIPKSHIFICTVPSVAGTGGLFSAEDIERLAVFPNPEVTALAEGEYMGFLPVMGMGYLPGLSQTLASNNQTLNAAILATLAAGGNDAFSLTSQELAIIEARVAEINAHIRSLAESNANVTLLDVHAFFERIRAKQVMIGGQHVLRNYHGGMFSSDGYHPSNTGYALVADEAIKVINGKNLMPAIPAVDLEAVWATDPYRDKDGDGYAPGPAPFVDNSMFNSLKDCDDTDNKVPAPYPVAGYWGRCGT